MTECEVGLRRAFIIQSKERRRSPSGLGFSQINYGRLFVRDYWTLFAIARELDCSVGDLVSPQDARTGPRWSELISASEEILELVRTLPAPLRAIVSQRGEGLSWRKIHQNSPTRAMYSMKEDYSQGLRTIVRHCSDPLNFLASLDNYFVVRRAA